MGSQPSNAMRKILLILSCILLAAGSCGGPMITRFYFVRGGTKTWLSTWLLAGGWPLILIPLAISYSNRRKTEGPKTKIIIMRLPVFISAVILGLLIGLVNYLSTFAVARLPVSTATLILSTSLVFTALSAFFLVNQKFTAYTVNAIVLLSVGAAVLALRVGSDRPAGESNKSYILGFTLLVAAAAGSGIIMPLIELTYKKAKQTVTYSLVMEYQMLMSISSTIFATVGMIVNNDFKTIPREAREFQLGETKYYVVLVSSAIIWQLYNLGLLGVIYCASALVSGIFIAVLLPVSQVLAVIFFHDNFSPEKGVSLALCLWGFVSYYYGEIKDRKKNQVHESEMTPKDTEMNQDEEFGIVPTAALA